MQHNYCVSLLRKSKRNYYSNLTLKDVTDNKKFWKSIKPPYTDKAKSAVCNSLKDNKRIVESQNRTGVPQGPTFGPLVFNIFVCDLFLILGNGYFASYASPTLSTKMQTSTKSPKELKENLV